MSTLFEGPDVRGGGEPVGLRIGLAIQTLDTLGGKERDAIAIGRGLAARGHEVTLLTRSASLNIPPGIAMHIIGSHGWTNHGRARLFARAVALARVANDFDGLLSFDKLRDADAYYAADVCFAPRARGLQGWLPRYVNYSRLETACFGADGPDILFLCRKQADEYGRHYSLCADRVVILPPMIHVSTQSGFYERRAAVRQCFGIPAEAILAVSVAVYARQKGVDRTVAALRDITGLHLITVGLKDMDSVKALAVKKGISTRARFIGHRDDVADIVGAADLMLHPARIENTGLVILESLLAGVPVIASAACGFAEYVDRFGAGIVLAEPFHATEYVAAIRTALEPTNLADLKRAARSSAPQLRAEGGVDPILDIIEETLRRRSSMRGRGGRRLAGASTQTTK